MSGDDPHRTSSLWIVHREPDQRAALALLAAAGENTLLGAPGDSLFESVSPPDVVVLGVTGDFERELEFAHRTSLRAPACAWILVATPRDIAEARRLFEDLPSLLLSAPPAALELRRSLRARLQRRDRAALSQRRRRDRLNERFSRWLGGLELPGMLRALDPKLARYPLLVRGEVGSGRGLVVRYVHTFGSSAERPLIHVACNRAQRESHLLEQMGDGKDGAAVWLDEVDTLPPALQRRVGDWIDFGLPGAAARLEPVRWMASAQQHQEGQTGPVLDPQLAERLSVLTVRTQALREQPRSIAELARETTRAWALANASPERPLAPDALELLQTYPWPGNQRELEALLHRTLAATSANPIRATHLQFDAADEWGPSDPATPAQETPSTHSAPPPSEPVASDVLMSDLGFDPEALALEQLADLGEPTATAPTPPRSEPPQTRERLDPVDIAALLDTLLDELRERIRSRRLLVLKEVDREEPFVMGDYESLRSAFAGLLSHALASVPDRGDMYLASSHHPAGLAGNPSVRVLLRYRKPAADAPPRSFDPDFEPASSGEQVFARARAVVEKLGGAFTGDSADPRETVILVDLPAPGPAPEA